MSTQPEANGPVAPAAEPRGAVIRRVEVAHESRAHRLLSKQLPALVVSGAVHVALVVALIAADSLAAKPAPPPPSDALLTVVPADEKDPAEVVLTNPDVGLAPELSAAVEADTLADLNVASAVLADDKPGLEAATNPDPADFVPPPGMDVPAALAGIDGTLGTAVSGGGGAAGATQADALQGRGGATKSKLLATGGGTEKSEAAVARSLVWLDKKQNKSAGPMNGAWVYDGSSADKTPASTGMALLPFLAAGQTHKGTAKDNKYKATVQAAMGYLLRQQLPDGSFKYASGLKGGDRREYMYVHAIATLALCELLGMSNDRDLDRPCQLAVRYIEAAQAGNGSWGYKPKENGDTSIVGWQVQALQAAKLCKRLVVSTAVLEKASKFLNSVASGPGKSLYGYAEPGSARPALSAIGLLCRYYVDGWGPNNPGMAAGVKALGEKNPPNPARLDMYYYYYATQVLHLHGGPEWTAWNAKMRDMLVDQQVRSGPNDGSWGNDKGQFLAPNCGRLGTTCMALLTLEVYYRHLPTYKRDFGGLKMLERGL